MMKYVVRSVATHHFITGHVTTGVMTVILTKAKMTQLIFILVKANEFVPNVVAPVLNGGVQIAEKIYLADLKNADGKK